MVLQTGGLDHNRGEPENCTGVAVAARFEMDDQIPPPREFQRSCTESYSYSGRSPVLVLVLDTSVDEYVGHHRPGRCCDASNAAPNGCDGALHGDRI